MLPNEKLEVNVDKTFQVLAIEVFPREKLQVNVVSVCQVLTDGMLVFPNEKLQTLSLIHI